MPWVRGALVGRHSAQGRAPAAQNVKMHCTYDVSDFPFDRQKCVMHYTSWMFHDLEVPAPPSYSPPSKWTGHGRCPCTR